MPPPEATLVFLPGFMTSPTSYAALLEPLSAHGIEVIAPRLYPRGLGALRGKHTVRQEAADTAALVGELPGRVFLAGHSRGGQAAWLAAGEAPIEGLLLLDPVDGQGRRPRTSLSTRVSSPFRGPAWILGAGIGGPCAPVGANHEQFARATPGAVHLVVHDLGHADMLAGRARSLGRRLCGGGKDPDAARELCTRLLADFVSGEVPGPGEHEGFRRIR
jgi:pimeloyl-ACP methyl ester carboxylesterase